METSAKYQGEFDNLNSTELTLGLPGVHQGGDEQPKMPTRKRAMDRELNRSETTKPSSEVTEPMAKVQVVGWPPVRSYRKNNMKVRKIEGDAINGVFVKVSMDGAPYLRKIDLMMYKSYGELQGTLENMFKCFSLGEAAGSDYAITYEDKDGDWMLVGDVPLGMFISSCKRLRIMRGSEATGLGSASN